MSSVTVTTENGTNPSAAILEVRDLQTVFQTDAGPLRAVDGVSFSVRPSEVFAIVGESGSGKTVTALSILGLVPQPEGKITGGEILYKDEDLCAMTPERLRGIRGNRISMIFQDPLTSLNPVQKVGEQIAEIFSVHGVHEKKEAWDRAVALLETVGIPRAGERAQDYPHQFSGGMRQRAMIAMAIALSPDIVIADEPTTALDVTIQAQILEVLLGIRDSFNTAIILITHDLGVVAGIADRVMVMYAGRKIEETDVWSLYQKPKHPYTWGLLGSASRPDMPRVDRMPQILGAPPNPVNPPQGCRFSPRCTHAEDVCTAQYPDLHLVGSQQVAACHFASSSDWVFGMSPSQERNAKIAAGVASPRSVTGGEDEAPVRVRKKTARKPERKPAAKTATRQSARKPKGKT